MEIASGSFGGTYCDDVAEAIVNFFINENLKEILKYSLVLLYHKNDK